ncbi:MAG: YkgJ family cysteine cluster protein [Chitinophagales bacterium]|nr:YkgJ family cysteine cluster protein [Chitinophagales bacterium]
MDYFKDLQLADQKFKENKKLLPKLKKMKGKSLDLLFEGKHEKVFSEIDCLKCANCCKTTSPIVLNSDIDRISKALGIKPSLFIEKYLLIDEDGDFVFNKQPCPFLGDDNYCSIYFDRPTACRDYPHTNRKNMSAILNLTLKNTKVCPAVARIFEEIK